MFVSITVKIESSAQLHIRTHQTDTAPQGRFYLRNKSKIFCVPASVNIYKYLTRCKAEVYNSEGRNYEHRPITMRLVLNDTNPS